MMPIDGDRQNINVYPFKNFLTRRDTNTVIVALEADECFVLIEDLAKYMAGGGPIYLVIESDLIYAKDME